jgi:hypothetical protein
MSVVGALDFQKDRGGLIRDIPVGRWPGLLPLTDEAQLTLPLAIRRRDCLPPEIQRRVDFNLARNAERAERTRRLYMNIERELRWRGVEFIVLKGMTHFPSFCDDLAHRPQFDIDLYCPPESIRIAAEAISALGYEPVGSGHTATADHLPAMIRKTGFRWRGDYYDPEMPLVVELHYRFWNPEREYFEVRGAEGFWSRRTRRIIPHRSGDCSVPALHAVDDLAFTTWHLVKHLLRGNLRLYHVYELAHFLHRTAAAELFWREWQASATETRTAEPIAFRLACEWFGCRIHPVVTDEIERLPPAVDRWFRLFAFSPVTARESPNKDELFLHLALARRPAERLRIAARKLIPPNPPRVVMDPHVKTASGSVRARRRIYLAGFLFSRAVRHIRSWSPVLQSGLRWWRQARRAA